MYFKIDKGMILVQPSIVIIIPESFFVNFLLNSSEEYNRSGSEKAGYQVGAIFRIHDKINS